MVNNLGKMMFKDENGLSKLKDRVSDTYGVNIETLLTYDELLETPKGEKNQHNVIIMPKGDGDVSAQREDVKTTFLLFH